MTVNVDDWRGRAVAALHLLGLHLGGGRGGLASGLCLA